MLEDAGIRTLMITGDHLATAIHTARKVVKPMGGDGLPCLPSTLSLNPSCCG